MQAPCEKPIIPSKGPFFCIKSYRYDTVSSKSANVSVTVKFRFSLLGAADSEIV